MNVWYWIDLKMLLAVFQVRRFCVEWLSMPKYALEYGSTVVFVVTLAIEGYVVPSALLRSTDWVLAVVALPFMLHEARSPEAVRIVKMITRSIIAVRTSLLVTAALVLLLDTLTLRTLMDVVFVANLWSLTVFHYVTSLPDGGSRRGQRRKLAADELRKMFGSWLPEPVPEGA